MAAQSVTGRAAWKALAAHHEKVRGLHLRKLFADLQHVRAQVAMGQSEVPSGGEHLT